LRNLNTKIQSGTPKIEKIVVNMGLGEAIQNVKIIDGAVQEMAMITGQRPVITKARKSIATFKLRTRNANCCSVTLRKEVMYEFFDHWLMSLCLK